MCAGRCMRLCQRFSKKAVEQSYQDCGWNLLESTNPYGRLYPNFNDIADNIKTIIDSSEYDDENKGAYKGALLTRIESLTNGINGLIFSNEELTNEHLFDTNVIVDLSRVGSTETNSLLMGILVLKLQEYRMANGDMNAELKHITVLEEAHNLLKRTSTEQMAESANLLGKSVEMLANAIAEMRTYGEGFIIADQAPGLMDLSVIRNTNTKIIMRLPDFSDRDLVGKSANLNDDQIIELAKLPKGVAAVYQNEWIQPVLCKVEKVEYDKTDYQYNGNSYFDTLSPSINLKLTALLTGNNSFDEITKKELKFDILNSTLSRKYVRQILDYCDETVYEVKMTQIAPIIAQLYPETMKAIRNVGMKSQDYKALTNAVIRELHKEVDGPLTNQLQINIVQALMTQYYFNELNDSSELEKWQNRGGLF